MRTDTKNAAILGENEQCGADSGALGLKIGDFDVRLAAIVQAWPTLPEATKDEIAALAQVAGIATQ